MELETEIIPMRANGMDRCRPPVSGSHPATLSSCPAGSRRRSIAVPHATDYYRLLSGHYDRSSELCGILGPWLLWSRGLTGSDVSLRGNHGYKLCLPAAEQR